MATQAINTSAPAHEGELLRYRVGPRLMHAVLAISFVLLLVTGLIIFWPPLAGYASGGTSRLLHRIGAVMFMAVPILYILFDRPAAKELLWDSFHYDKDDLRWLARMPRYFMGHAVEMPPQGRLNAGQKFHHAGVVVFSAAIVASGLILWFGKGTLGPEGLAVWAMVHDLSMLILTVLLVGHLYFTFVYKALSGMVTGYVPEEEAMIEHPKWVEEVKEGHSESSEIEESASCGEKRLRDQEIHGD
jgi:formate dehydrogenase subunit gamma